MIPINRQEALRVKASRYFTGKPCVNGHVDRRRTDNGACISCLRNLNTEWLNSNPDRRAAINGKTLAARRAPDCIPASFDIEPTISFYSKARKLTKSTGIPHEVDHITPLVEGGLHVYWNLRVLTKADNIARTVKR